MTISDEDLRGLSAVEREALLAIEDGDEDVARELGGSAHAEDTPAPAAPAATLDDDRDEDDPEPAPAAASPKPADEPADAPSPAPAEPAAPAESEPAPRPQLSTPHDAAEQRKALRLERNTALQELLNGEIEPEAFYEIDAKAQDKLDALVRAEASDHARAQVLYDAMIGEYTKEMRAVHKNLSDAGLDVKEVGEEFHRLVHVFAREADLRGLSDAPGNLAASKAALADATEYLLRRHGKTPAAAPAPVPAPAPAKPARQPKPVDRSTFPPTLANVPTAADATISSEFAHLEGLDDSTLERALARLTPEQQERYLP